jgi:hypothetical protein
MIHLIMTINYQYFPLLVSRLNPSANRGCSLVYSLVVAYFLIALKMKMTEKIWNPMDITVMAQ